MDKPSSLRRDMVPSDNMALVPATTMTHAAALPHAGPFVGTGVNTTGLRPFALETAAGSRFEMSDFSVAGLENQGLVFGAVRNEKLHLIAYTGTR